MYYINPNILPQIKIDIPKYHSIDIQENYFVLIPDKENIEFDPESLNASEKSLAENYIPPIIALIAVRGSDMYSAFRLDRGTMQAVINDRKYIVTLIADNFTDSASNYFPAGLAEIGPT